MSTHAAFAIFRGAALSSECENSLTCRHAYGAIKQLCFCLYFDRRKKEWLQRRNPRLLARALRKVSKSVVKTSLPGPNSRAAAKRQLPKRKPQLRRSRQLRRP